MRTRLCLIAIVGLAAAGSAAAGQPDAHAASPGAAGLAEIVAATYLGGPGTEWLASGGFLPDGRVILAGVSLDDEVTIAGVKAEVLGEDAPPTTPLPKFVPLLAEAQETVDLPALEDSIKGREAADLLNPPKPIPKGTKVPKKDEWGNVQYEKLAWHRADATGFLAVASPRLDKVLIVRRFPRGAGSITSVAVAKDGSIYLAGAATERIDRLAPDAKVIAAAEITPGRPGCQRTYLAKLAADASRVLWVRRLDGPSVSPKVRVLSDGRALFTGPDVRVFSADGEPLSAVAVAKGVSGGTGVSPRDGTIAKAGEWMWGTGREPWRCPTLHLYHPDGRLRYQLAAWAGPLVGTNAFRLVADSTLRKAVWDDQGNLVLTGWSHGGNTVNARRPQDIERFWPYNGLGYNIDNSCNYVIKLEPNDFQVTAATAWPGGKIWAVGCAVDGSVAWNGEPSHFFRRTHTDFTDADGGDALVVVDPTMRQYRFFVPMPACGNQVAVTGDEKVPEDWGIASGWVGGKAMLLFLSGALETQRTAKGAFAAPTLRPVQKGFAGGGMDGYALLLELEPAPAALAPAKEPTAPSSSPAAAPGQTPKRTQREPLRWPPKEGQVFKIAPQRFRTVMIAFRDPSDRMWPSFVYGGPDTQGSFTFTTKAKPQAAFSLLCREVAQPEGEQDRRVLGELVRLSLKTTEEGGRTRTEKVMEPVVRFVLTDMAPWRLEDVSTIRGETEHVRTRIACDVSGDLTIGSRTIAVRNAPCTATFRVEADRAFRGDVTATPNTVDLSLALTVKGKDLGLKAPLAQGDIAIRITWTGTDQVTYFTPPNVSDHIPDVELKE